MAYFTTISTAKAKPGKAKELEELFVQVDEKIARLPGMLNKQTLRQQDNTDIFWFVETWENEDAHMEAIFEEGIRELVIKAVALFDTIPDVGIKMTLQAWSKVLMLTQSVAMRKSILLVFAVMLSNIAVMKSQHCGWDGSSMIIVEPIDVATGQLIDGLTLVLADSNSVPYKSTSNFEQNRDLNIYQHTDTLKFGQNYPGDPHKKYQVVAVPFDPTKIAQMCSDKEIWNDKTYADKVKIKVYLKGKN
ncbi:MAG: antibiotic biosynthesis monooxygenase [Ignavibacteriae bacterium]|nr:antibiotic biosynthesis monooxygenase [Ignavibacteriota bacterium]